MRDAGVDVREVLLPQVLRLTHDFAAVVGDAPAPAAGILEISPWACRRQKHPPTSALAFLGSLAHARSSCMLISRARASRLEKPCRQCSSAIRFWNSVASGCASQRIEPRARAAPGILLHGGQTLQRVLARRRIIHRSQCIEVASVSLQRNLGMRPAKFS